MRGSLGLAAYKALARQGSAVEFRCDIERPEGSLVWMHAAEPGNETTILDQARAMVTQIPDAHVLMTTGPDRPALDPGDSGVLTLEISTDHPDYVAAFFDHWRPDILIWTWGGLKPNLVMAAQARGVFLVLADAAASGFDRRQDRWLPEVPRRLLSLFDRVIVRSEAAFHKLAQLGYPLGKIQKNTPLQSLGEALPFQESDLSEVGAALNGRPCWLVYSARRAELDTIITAHLQALRTSYRLLLILVLVDANDTEDALEHMRQKGLQVTDWEYGEMPRDSAQVLLAADNQDLGLWLRLAPVAFGCGSQSDARSEIHPYVLAAHGCALIYSGRDSAYLKELMHLEQRGGALLVQDSDQLGKIVTRAIVPDKAAEMALAGWRVLSDGDRALNALISEVQAYLGAPEGDTQ